MIVIAYAFFSVKVMQNLYLSSSLSIKIFSFLFQNWRPVGLSAVIFSGCGWLESIHGY